MTDLADLIARLEAAEGADHLLDEAIITAIGRRRAGSWWIGHAYVGRYPPNYTQSVDAAMSLVPEGWGWAIRNTGYARLLSPKRQPDDREGYAATPALALTAACLRALQHGQGS